MLKELFAAEILKVGIFHPARGQFLVREIVGVFEDREPRHQPHRQGRLARNIRINRAKARFEKRPLDGKRQKHKLMAKVDDLVEPCLEQIVLPRFALRLWLHAPLPKMHAERESCFAALAKLAVDFCRLFKRFGLKSCKSKP